MSRPPNGAEKTGKTEENQKLAPEFPAGTSREQEGNKK
jgi:hypothetical protein